ncbi:outer-membrane lipoprotein carrier protein LolA [Hansschlegelia plantiphila]|uniref:Outer-membrane lipoprotein carrier protein n=1 Tax=Hansschlegelia plantiphila TaxID=374655 RepID=A0A9W6MWB8_9HYPH|nr:outer-membrane lipoprotein carrier protein LolA [Hansschlegelia plantiphila]GLK68695.1 outer-membrane lipoprotein carrier protein [Hansschlegelia plantiphila]
MTLRRSAAAFAILSALAAAPAAAQSASGTPADVPPPPQVQLAATNKGVPVSKLDPVQRATLTRVNAYFNSIQDMTASFEQTGPDGSRSVGKLYLSRPGKIRFQYAPPSPLEIVSNGSSVVVKNRKLSTQEIYPLSQTPLRVLLADKIDLLRDTDVIGVYQEPEMVSVVLVQKNAIGGSAQIQLLFSGQNYELKQWTVTDAQGMDTSVVLTDVNAQAKLDANLFRIQAQSFQGGPRRP